MTTAADIVKVVADSVGHPPNSDEGIQHGSAGTEVRRLVVCWMAAVEAIEHAGRIGAEFLIGHESLYYPYNAVNRPDAPPGWQDWPVNRARREALERHGLTFARMHGSVDELCIFDVFAEKLGLGEPAAADGLAKVYDVEPCTLGELVDRVKECMGMAPLRVSAPNGLGQRVSRIGLPWGGLGLWTNVGYQEKLLEMGCDALVAGEACSYGFRFSAECGVPMIETSHEDSENPGLRRFCQILSERFPDLDVRFYELPRPWNWA